MRDLTQGHQIVGSFCTMQQHTIILYLSTKNLQTLNSERRVIFACFSVTRARQEGVLGIAGVRIDAADVETV